MKRKGKPVSRRTFDKVVAYYQEALCRLNKYIMGLEADRDRLLEANGRFDHYAAECNKAKVAAEVERDQLKARLENAVSDRDLANAAYQSLAQRYSRLARHRELLLDVMTSAEDAGTDFASLRETGAGAILEGQDAKAQERDRT